MSQLKTDYDSEKKQFSGHRDWRRLQLSAAPLRQIHFFDKQFQRSCKVKSHWSCALSTYGLLFVIDFGKKKEWHCKWITKRVCSSFFLSLNQIQWIKPFRLITRNILQIHKNKRKQAYLTFFHTSNEFEFWVLQGRNQNKRGFLCFKSVYCYQNSSFWFLIAMFALWQFKNVQHKAMLSSFLSWAFFFVWNKKSICLYPSLFWSLLIFFFSFKITTINQKVTKVASKHVQS